MTENAYGVVRQYAESGQFARQKEALLRQGYTLIDSGFSDHKMDRIKNSIDKLKESYSSILMMGSDKAGIETLKKIDEHNTLRCPLLFDSIFLDVCLNSNVLNFIRLIMGDRRFILNQQNAIINPAMENYNQGKWHRDFPYQHFVANVPLGITALLCVDDFTLENGATAVIPGSHLFDEFPSDFYIADQQIQITARKGMFIVMDCMTYHCGAFNMTEKDRYAINNVYATPLIRRQIDFDIADFRYDLTSTLVDADYTDVLGMTYRGHSLQSFLQSRKFLT